MVHWPSILVCFVGFRPVRNSLSKQRYNNGITTPKVDLCFLHACMFTYAHAFVHTLKYTHTHKEGRGRKGGIEREE